MTAEQLLHQAADDKEQLVANRRFLHTHVSQKVPSIMLALAAGQPEMGYCYPQHHPKVKFDEAALPIGTAIYAYTAIQWLKEHK